MIISTSLVVQAFNVYLLLDKFVYYDSDEEMTYFEAVIRCSKLGGRLPSVHSRKHIDQLSQLIGPNNQTWLGSDFQPGPEMDETHYTWLDGTPFNSSYSSQSSKGCPGICCALAISNKLQRIPDGWVSISCWEKAKAPCVLPYLTFDSMLESKNSRTMKELTATVYNLNIRNYICFSAVFILFVITLIAAFVFIRAKLASLAWKRKVHQQYAQHLSLDSSVVDSYRSTLNRI